MKAIKKFFKFIFWLAVWLLVAIVAAVLTIPLWIGPVVTRVANWKVPAITGTAFHLGEFQMNPYTGRLHIGDMQLQNPKSFFTAYEAKAKSFSEVKGDGILDAAWEHTKNVGQMMGDAVATVGDTLASSETNAVSFTAIDVRFDTLSFVSDNIHIEEVCVKDLYFYGDLTFSNIREIADNAKKGGKDQPKAEAPKAEEPKAEEPKAEEPSPKTPQPEAKKQKKVVIDRIFITGTRIQWGHVAIPVPDIELKDVGKGEDMDGEAVFKQVIDAICDAADKIAGGAGSALKVAIEGLDNVGEVINGGIDAAKDVLGTGMDAATDALGAGMDAASNAFGAGMDAVTGVFSSDSSDKDENSGTVGSGVEATTGAISTTLESASGAVGTGLNAATGAVSTGVNAIGSGIGAGVDAVGSGIGSAFNFITGSDDKKESDK